MKWIVFFLLFSLVFLSGPQLERETVQKDPNGQRNPAAEKNCADIIATFYSKERNHRFLETRIASAKTDLHLFYRSFPPLFYKMAEDLKWKNHFKKVSETVAVMAGDAHMENFGLRYHNGDLRLSVNDFDDVTNGPVFMDVLRLLGSANLAGVDVDEKLIDDVLKSYRKGLKEKEWTYSSSVEDLFKKSVKADELDKKYIDQKNARFLAKKTPATDIQKSELEKWENVFKDIGEIKDSYLYIKQNGGSAGLKRFQFLLEKDGKLTWIEAKEWSRPSYNAGTVVTNSAVPSDLKRFEMISTYDQPNVPSRMAKINGTTFFIRQIDDRQKGVSLADLSAKKMEDVLNDEAYSLGVFHSTFLSHSKDFENIVEQNVEASDVKDFVFALTQKIKEAQQSL